MLRVAEQPVDQDAASVGSLEFASVKLADEVGLVVVCDRVDAPTSDISLDKIGISNKEKAPNDVLLTEADAFIIGNAFRGVCIEPRDKSPTNSYLAPSLH